ncbi:MAG: hypothetical protein ACOC1G_06630 [Phycisphaeraceae bacterium]
MAHPRTFSRPPAPRRRLRSLTTLGLAGFIALVAGTPLIAVQPQRWVHTTEADFQDGETEDVAITNLGDLKLAKAVEDLAELPDGVSIVFDAQRYDGDLYIAGGPQGVLLKLTDDGFETVAEFPGEQVFCLHEGPDGLLVGISGESSRVMTYDGEELREAVRLDEVRYLWDMETNGRELYLATGTEGRVLAATIDPEGEVAEGEAIRTLLDSEQANVLCLDLDDAGRLYAGTDTQGLVFRLTLVGEDEVEPYVLLDAAEPEIGDLVVMPDGTVYAGTADANQARPGRLEQPAAQEAGRPAGGAEPQDGDAGEAQPDAPEAPGPGDIPETPPQPEPVDGDTQPAEGDADADADDAPDADAEDAPDADAVDDTDTAAEPAEPTAEQYDRLREMVQARLDDAAEGQRLQVGPGDMQNQANRGGPAGGSRVRAPATAGPSKPGNAVYRIDPEGFVSEVFRESVMILRLVPTDRGILAATGNEGQVYRINPDTEETLILTNLEVEQVPTALPFDDGAILLGTASPGRLVRLSPERAERGAYTSRVLDANQVSMWGILRLTADIPEGARIEVQTRSSNVGDPDNPAWSKWTPAAVLPRDADHPPLQPREVDVEAPPARFFQYRLTLHADADQAPTVERVEAAYVMPNLPPSITALTAERNEPDLTGENPPSTEVKLSWKVTDPNEDRLTYDLHFRPQNSDRFLKLAEDLDQNRYAWQTRRVPDGWYRVRVTAHDGLDNPPDMTRSTSRLSDPILVDHTPPTIEATATVDDAGNVTIAGTAEDERAPIASIAHIRNDAEQYVPLLPEDLILDSTSESFEVTLQGFDPGPHVVTLRVIDTQGNAAYKALTFTVDEE